MPKKIIDCLLIFSILVDIPLSMYIWGRVLVLLGVLTKEEANGYPFSKPWENNCLPLDKFEKNNQKL